MKKLKDLKKIQNQEELNFGIEYDEGMDEEENFICMKIINPYNEQTLIFARVPQNMEQSLQDEISLANTSRYHDWVSTWTEFKEKHEEENIEENIEEIVEEWNSTELGTRYPISKEDIEEEKNNYFKINKDFKIRY